MQHIIAMLKRLQKAFPGRYVSIDMEHSLDGKGQVFFQWSVFIERRLLDDKNVGWKSFDKFEDMVNHVNRIVESHHVGESFKSIVGSEEPNYPEGEVDPYAGHEPNRLNGYFRGD